MLWLTLRQLKSKKIPARRRAAERLCQSPDAKAFDALVAALADPDDEVRRFIVTALSKLEDDRRHEALITALHDRDPEVLKSAMTGLKNHPDERLVPAMIQLIRHADAGVRGYAATLLSARGWRPEEKEEQLNYQIARGQLAKAAKHGAAAIQALENVILTGAYDQRIAAARALGLIEDKRVIKPLLAALRSKDPAVCAAAIGALGETGDEQICDSIAEMLRHDNDQVRTVTAEVLARLGGNKVVDKLTPLLGDAVWDVRRATAAALGKIKDARAVLPLTECLQDKDADVREAAAIALGNLRDSRAIGPLVKALADTTSGVRRIAAGALSRIDENWSSTPEAKTAILELQHSLLELDSELRYAVSKLLTSLGGHTPETEILMPKETPSAAPDKRRKLAASLLVATLSNVNNLLRQAAAESLGHLGVQHAAPSLQKALIDPDAGVRRAAERALAELEQSKEAA